VFVKQTSFFKILQFPRSLISSQLVDTLHNSSTLLSWNSKLSINLY